MTREYVENMKSEAMQDMQKAKQSLIDFYKNAGLPQDLTDFITEKAERELGKDSYSSLDFGLLIADVLGFYYIKYGKDSAEASQLLASILPTVEKMKKDSKEIASKFRNAVGYAYHDFDRYVDVGPVEFDGDIIITDPCYVTKDEKSLFNYPNHDDYVDKSASPEVQGRQEIEYWKIYDAWKEKNPSDWKLAEYGRHMEKLGFTNFISHDTIYGDWSCTTFNLDDEDGEPFGRFCADAGMVGVFLLDEVLKNNPDFDYHLKWDWTTTWIKDFKGTVKLVVTEEFWTLEEDYSWGKKGTQMVDYVVSLEGHGINKVTGEPINFKTEQTGM